MRVAVWQVRIVQGKKKENREFSGNYMDRITFNQYIFFFQTLTKKYLR